LYHNRSLVETVNAIAVPSSVWILVERAGAPVTPSYTRSTRTTHRNVHSRKQTSQFLSGDSWITRSTVICTAHKIPLGWSNPVGWGAGDIRRLETHVESEVQAW